MRSRGLGSALVDTDVLIVGGGLAGLSIAHQLDRSGRDWRLVEARDRLGGRVRSVTSRADPTPEDRYDLGPSWFWHGQPLMARLVEDLGLSVFEQHSAGRFVMQDGDGAVRRDFDFAPMAGSLRLAGGMTSLIDALARRVPGYRVAIGHAVTHLRFTGDGIRVAVVHSGGRIEITARQVVLALPPRLAARAITFTPALSSAQMSAMRTIPTWMAGHAKLVAIYPTPFWRETGLSGDGMSRCGPLLEIHDASPASAAAGALFGFVGVAPQERRGVAEALIEASIAQLSAMFGPEATSPLDVLFEDWANDTRTATSDDQVRVNHHPTYGMPDLLADLWNGRLILGSTEMAPIHGGLLEGALEAAGAAILALGRHGRHPGPPACAIRDAK